MEKGEISLLAIAETMFATVFAIYLSVKFESFKWIAWSACIAPLLLPRTEQSTVWGIEQFDRHFRRLDEKVQADSQVSEFRMILKFWSLAFSAALLKIVSLARK